MDIGQHNLSFSKYVLEEVRESVIRGCYYFAYVFRGVQGICYGRASPIIWHMYLPVVRESIQHCYTSIMSNVNFLVVMINGNHTSLSGGHLPLQLHTTHFCKVL